MLFIAVFTSFFVISCAFSGIITNNRGKLWLKMSSDKDRLLSVFSDSSDNSIFVSPESKRPLTTETRYLGLYKEKYLKDGATGERFDVKTLPGGMQYLDITLEVQLSITINITTYITSHVCHPAENRADLAASFIY